LLELGTDTGSPQTPFLGEGPKLKEMMVIEVTPAPLVLMEDIIRFFVLSKLMAKVKSG
jgi:hypothetical protein